MAQNPLIKRYLDAGMAFTQMTQAKAEAIVRDLVNTGEVQANGIEEMVNELLERSRRNTETLLELVRSEVRSQLVSLGLLDDEATSTGATGDSGVEQQIGQHRPPQRPPAPAADEATDAIAAQAAAGETSATAVAPAKAVPAKKATAVKKSAKKASAKKASAKKAAAKKASAKKASAKKVAAKKVAAKKATGNKKASVKKAAAKKAGA